MSDKQISYLTKVYVTTHRVSHPADGNIVGFDQHADTEWEKVFSGFKQIRGGTLDESLPIVELGELENLGQRGEKRGTHQQ